LAVVATAVTLAPGCATHQCDSTNLDYYGGEMVGPDMYVTNDLSEDWVPYKGQETLHVHFPPGIGRKPFNIQAQVGTSQQPNEGAGFMGGDLNTIGAGQLDENFFSDENGFFAINASCADYFARFTVTFPPVLFTLTGGYGVPSAVDAGMPSQDGGLDAGAYAAAGDGGADAGEGGIAAPAAARVPGLAELHETWTWDGSHWTAVYTSSPPPSSPPARSGITVAVAGASPTFFGGELGTPGDMNVDSSMFSWDGVSWNQKFWTCPGSTGCPCCPTGRTNGVFVTLPGQPEDGGTVDKIVMFGGRAATPVDGGTVSRAINELDVWDGTTWTQPKRSKDKSVSVDSPPARFGAAGAAVAGKVYVFSGTADGRTPIDDFWTWNDGTQSWGPILVFGPRPAPRFGASAASFGDVIMIFGGNDGTKDLDDTWLFDGTAWTQVTGAGPSARSNAAVGAFDHPTPALLLFGGDTAGVPLGDFWSWNGSSWQEIPDLDGSFPSPRTGAGAGGI
jgi:hypothetical protein